MRRHCLFHDSAVGSPTFTAAATAAAITTARMPAVSTLAVATAPAAAPTRSHVISRSFDANAPAVGNSSVILEVVISPQIRA